eukprot:g1590.t1
MDFMFLLQSKVNVRSAFAECLCTTLLLYFGLGTSLLTHNIFFTSLVFGTAVTALIYMVHHSEAGQMNPAISVALAAAGYIPAPQALLNSFAQFVGGIIAAALLLASMPRGMAGNIVANRIDENFDIHQAIVAEILSAFLLQLCVFETMLHPRNKVGKLAPVAIGFIVFVVHGVLIPIDRCSVNPARAFGPALLSATWDDFWIFILMPFVGALLAIPVHIVFLLEKAPQGSVHRKTNTELELA